MLKLSSGRPSDTPLSSREHLLYLRPCVPRFCAARWSGQCIIAGLSQAQPLLPEYSWSDSDISIMLQGDAHVIASIHTPRKASRNFLSLVSEVRPPAQVKFPQGYYSALRNPACLGIASAQLRAYEARAHGVTRGFQHLSPNQSNLAESHNPVLA